MIKIILPVEKVEYEILNHFVDEYDICEDYKKDKEFTFTFDFSHMGKPYKIEVVYNITKQGYIEWQRSWIDAGKNVDIHFSHINHNPEAPTLQTQIDIEMARKERIKEENDRTA